MEQLPSRNTFYRADSWLTMKNDVAKYLLIAASTLFACVVASMLVVAIVDPYGVSGAPRLQGFNERKTRLANQLVAVKFARLQSVQPRTVVIGSSRIDRGFDPMGASWPDSARPVFNLGIPAAPLSDRLPYFQRLLEASPATETVIFGLDYLDYLEEFVLLKETRRVSAQTPLVNQLTPYFGWRALLDAVRTPFEQRRESYYRMTANGFSAGHALNIEIQRFGHGAYVRRMLAEHTHSLRQILAPVPARELCCPTHYRVVLQQIVDTAVMHDVNLILIALPYHAEYLEAFDDVGLMEYADQWHRDLLAVARQARADNSGRSSLVWSFFNYSSMSSEPIPELNATEDRMENFYDPGYFTPRFGDRMVAEIFGQAFGERYGTVIDTETVEKTIEEFHDGRLMYLRQKIE